MEAPAAVDDQSAALQQLKTITHRKRIRAGQSVKAFNPLSLDDQRIFKALLSGADTVNGFRNQDIRAPLALFCGLVDVVWSNNRPKYPCY